MFLLFCLAINCVALYTMMAMIDGSITHANFHFTYHQRGILLLSIELISNLREKKYVFTQIYLNIFFNLISFLVFFIFLCFLFFFISLVLTVFIFSSATSSSSLSPYLFFPPSLSWSFSSLFSFPSSSSSSLFSCSSSCFLLLLFILLLNHILLWLASIGGRSNRFSAVACMSTLIFYFLPLYHRLFNHLNIKLLPCCTDVEFFIKKERVHLSPPWQ